MKIRNIGIIAHIDAGKTTTTERLLYHAGIIRKPGNVDTGTTTTDYLPQERERGITIKAAAITFPWRNNLNDDPHLINLIDTPGHVDFGGEVVRALRVMEGAVCVLDASKGVEAQTMAGWRLTERYNVRRIIFVNKIDKVGADLSKCMSSIKEKLQIAPLLLQKPTGERSLVDLVGSQEMEWDDKGNIIKKVANKIYQKQFLESLAEHSDIILESLGNDEAVDELTVKGEIQRLTFLNSIVPVLFGSSLKNFGTQPILDAVCDYLPSPTSTKEQKVFCFKVAFDDNRPLVFVRVYGSSNFEPGTVYNVNRGSRPIRVHKLFQVQADELIPVESIPAGGIGVITGLDENVVCTGDTLSPVKIAEPLFPLEVPRPVFMRRVDAPTREAWDQLDAWLARLCKEDPSLQVVKDERMGQTLLAGMGELHLDVVHRRLLDELKIDVHLGTVLVKKYYALSTAFQVSLNEKFTVKVDLLPQGEYESVVESNEFHRFPLNLPELRQGVEGALTRGRDGNSLIGLNCTLLTHETEVPIATLTLLQVHDSMHFALMSQKLLLLEPMVKCTITLPPVHLGAVLSDLYANRAGVLLEQHDSTSITLEALMPLEKSVGYATWLRTLTAGNGTLEMQNIGYRFAH